MNHCLLRFARSCALADAHRMEADRLLDELLTMATDPAEQCELRTAYQATYAAERLAMAHDHQAAVIAIHVEHCQALLDRMLPQ